MQSQITRRGLLAVAAAALPGAAQQPPPPIPANAEEELAAARAQARSNAELLAKVKLSPTVEPAVHFRA